MFKWKLKSFILGSGIDYYCHCHNKKHSMPLGLNFIASFIGVAVGLGVNKEAQDVR